MVRWAVWGCLLLLGVALAGCGPRLSQVDDADTHAVIEQLRHRQYAAIEARLDPQMDTQGADPALREAARLFPPQEPTGQRITNVRTVTMNGGRIITVSRLYSFAHVQLATSVALRRLTDGRVIILGVQVDPVNARR